MASSLFPPPNINPRPILQTFVCPQCGSHALGTLTCGTAQVSVLENYGRWFQVVCNLFLLRYIFQGIL
jgi:hypothetical protein